MSLLRFYDQECMSVFVVFVRALGGACALLPPDLCSGYYDRTQMPTASLGEPLETQTPLKIRGSYRFIVLQYGTLENKIPPLPASEVFASLGQVTLFVSGRCNGLTSTNYVGCEERGDFISVFDWKRKNGLEVVLQRDLHEQST